MLSFTKTNQSSTDNQLLDAKPIKNFIDYFITIEGKVISKKFGKYRELKQAVYGDGYPYVILCEGGIKFICRIAQLVADAYIPIIPNTVIRHKDGNLLNNNANNLERVPRTYYVYPRRKSPIKTNKLTTEAIHTIRQMCKEGQRQVYVAKVFGIDSSNISRIIKGKTYKRIESK